MYIIQFQLHYMRANCSRGALAFMLSSYLAPIPPTPTDRSATLLLFLSYFSMFTSCLYVLYKLGGEGGAEKTSVKNWGLFQFFFFSPIALHNFTPNWNEFGCSWSKFAKLFFSTPKMFRLLTGGRWVWKKKILEVTESVSACIEL